MKAHFCFVEGNVTKYVDVCYKTSCMVMWKDLTWNYDIIYWSTDTDNERKF